MVGAEMEIKVVRVEVPRENGYRALLRVTGLLDRVMQPYFSRFGISRSQWACLRVLHRAEQEGKGLRPVDLGRRLLVRPPSITGLMGRLGNLGYVTSNSSLDDARGKEVRLTARGRKLVERILKGHAAQIAAVMAGLDAVGQQQLTLLLQRLAAHLESMVEAGNRAAVVQPGNPRRMESPPPGRSDSQSASGFNLK